jgi:hypothetical protein
MLVVCVISAKVMLAGMRPTEGMGRQRIFAMDIQSQKNPMQNLKG